MHLEVLNDILGLEVPDEDARVTTPTNQIAMIMKETTTCEVTTIL